MVLVWRAELLRFLPALQAKIVQLIARGESGVDHSRHAATWQFAPNCGCPVNYLPPPERWRAKPPAQVDPVTPTLPKRRFDLPPSELDQVRDERDDIPSIFAASQPGFVDRRPIDWPKPRT